VLQRGVFHCVAVCFTVLHRVTLCCIDRAPCRKCCKYDLPYRGVLQCYRSLLKYIDLCSMSLWIHIGLFRYRSLQPVENVVNTIRRNEVYVVVWCSVLQRGVAWCV